MTHKLVGTAASLIAVLGFGSPALAAQSAQATLNNSNGERVGTVEMRATPNETVWLRLSAEGLEPGTHAFHIHETGQCTPDFEAAGGHFNPGNKELGILVEGGPHAGDFPNIHVPASGKLTVEFFGDGISLEEGAQGSVFDDDGSAIIIHSGADDYESQPAGDAGNRIACGVISTS